MNSILKVAATAALLAASSTLVMAQAQEKNPTGLTPPDLKATPANPPPAAPPAGVGSRPMGPPGNPTGLTPPDAKAAPATPPATAAPANPGPSEPKDAKEQKKNLP